MAQERQRRRRRRRGGGVARPARRTPPRWRQVLDSFGGFLTVGAVGGAILIVLFLVLRNPLTSSSEAPLLGEDRPQTVRALHTDNPASIVGRPGEPPTGGAMFVQPQRPGVYDAPIADGNAVHSLEHGIVWITYNPDLVDASAIDTLRDVARAFRRDVILSPRPQNEVAIAAVSWGRILSLDALDEQSLRDFADTNRNRSPEPGAR